MKPIFARNLSNAGRLVRDLTAFAPLCLPAPLRIALSGRSTTNAGPNASAISIETTSRREADGGTMPY